MPDEQVESLVMLQFPLPSQDWVLTVPPEHDVAPQTVPAGEYPFLTHFGPLEQDIFPVSHGSDTAQASPTVHETQLPELQTRFFPQLVPSSATVPVSWHV
jgi:hypothetical protein